MRRYISILLLSLFIFHGTVQIFILKLFQATYQQEILELIDKGFDMDELTLFIFHKDDVQHVSGSVRWIGDDEFLSDQQLYDIVDTKSFQDSVYAYCILDQNETDLYAIMEKLFESMIDDDPEKESELKCFSNSISQYYSKPKSSEITTDQSAFEESFEKLCPNPLDGEHLSITHPPRS